jgi:hypothetical protein
MSRYYVPTNPDRRGRLQLEHASVPDPEMAELGWRPATRKETVRLWLTEGRWSVLGVTGALFIYTVVLTLLGWLH